MPSYRPICDTWVLARSKVPYYGAYPAGFLHRARALLGVGIDDPVLHVCSGRITAYPYSGFGPNDKTLDLDPLMEPTYVQDAREPFPLRVYGHDLVPWPAVLMDPPYTEDDAEVYALGGRHVLPRPNLLLKNALDVVAVGSKVGLLHYVWPQPPTVKVENSIEGWSEHVPRAKETAVVTVLTGRNNRARLLTVWEKLR